MPPNIESLHVDVIELKTDMRHISVKLDDVMQHVNVSMDRQAAALETLASIAARLAMVEGLEARVRACEHAGVAQADVVRRVVVVEAVQAAHQEKISGTNQRLAGYAGGITVVSVVLTAIARKMGF